MATENTVIFPAVSTFKMRRLIVGGADSDITDTNFLNIVRRWAFPAKAGEGTFPLNFPVRTQLEENPTLDPFDYGPFDSINVSQENLSGGKPYMLTVEGGSDGQEHWVLYTTSLKIADFLSSNDFIKNPAITDDGDNKIRKLDGGTISSLTAGITWPQLAEGTVTPKESVTLPEVLSPFLLFRRADIS